MTTVDVTPLKMPLLDQSPAMVCTRPTPPLKIAPGPMNRPPLKVQSAAAVTPAGWVLATATDPNGCASAPKEIWPVPPNTTASLEKEVPPSASVTAAEGLNTRVPALVTVPRLVKLPSNVCVAEPPSKSALLPTAKPP